MLLPLLLAFLAMADSTSLFNVHDASPDSEFTRLRKNMDVLSKIWNSSVSIVSNSFTDGYVCACPLKFYDDFKDEHEYDEVFRLIAGFVKYLVDGENRFKEKLLVKYGEGIENRTKAALAMAIDGLTNYSAGGEDASAVADVLGMITDPTGDVFAFYNAINSNFTENQTNTTIENLSERMCRSLEQACSEMEIVTDAALCDITVENPSACFQTFHSENLTTRLGEHFLDLINDPEAKKAADEFESHLNRNSISGESLFFIMFVIFIAAIAIFIIKSIETQRTEQQSTLGVSEILDACVMVIGFAFGAIMIAVYKGEGNHFVLDYIEIAVVDADVLFYVFMPVLVFFIAFSMDINMFSRMLGQVLFISFLAFIFATLLTAPIAYELLHKDLSSVNDAFTVLLAALWTCQNGMPLVNRLKDVGVSVFLQTSLTAETLFTTVSAYAAMTLILTFIKADEDDWVQQSTRLVERILLEIIAAPLYGYSLGVLSVMLIEQIHNIWLAEILVLISLPFIAFYTANEYLVLSGISTTAVLGLVVNEQRAGISASIQLLIHRTWNLLYEVSEIVVSALSGVIMALICFASTAIRAEHFLYLIGLYFFINSIRQIVIGSCALLFKLANVKHNSLLHADVIFLTTWAGTSGNIAVLLTLLLQNEGYFRSHYSDNAIILALFYIIGLSMMSTVVNAVTLTPAFSFIGLMKISHAQVISINAAMRELESSRIARIHSLKRDRMLADADWEKVEQETRLKSPYLITEKEELRDLITAQTPEEAASQCLGGTESHDHEVHEVARQRLLKAMKQSFNRQYEEGLLGVSAEKALTNYVERIEHKHHDDLLDSSFVLQHLQIVQMQNMRQNLTENNQFIITEESRKRKKMPDNLVKIRRPCYKLAYKTWFNVLIYLVIFYQIVDTIASLIVQSEGANVFEITDVDIYFYTATFFFAVFYVFEATVKLFAWGWSGYWSNTWLNWNRMDFILMILACFDAAIDIFLIVIATSDFRNSGDSQTVQDLNQSIRIVRFFRLFRLSRVFRFLKPVSHLLVRILDKSINRKLSKGFDIGKAYVIANEEMMRLVPIIVDSHDDIRFYKEVFERERVKVIRALGMIAETRPNIAVAVKTRQAVRHVLNQLRNTVTEIRNEGIIDDEEAQRFVEEFDKKISRLVRFPFSLPVPSKESMLRNIPWMEGQSDFFFDMLEDHLEEREFQNGDLVCPSDQVVDGIILITSGVLKLKLASGVDNWVRYSDCIFLEVDDSLEEYIPRGNVINEVGTVLNVPRSSDVYAATHPVRIYHISRNSLKRVFRKFPSVEKRLIHHIATSVAIRVLARSPAYEGYALDQLRNVFEYSYVRLLPPFAEMDNLFAFKFVFIIYGMVEDAQQRGRIYEGPMLLPSSLTSVITLPYDLNAYQLYDEQDFLARKKLDWTKYTILCFVSEEPMQAPKMYEEFLPPPDEPRHHHHHDDQSSLRESKIIRLSQRGNDSVRIPAAKTHWARQSFRGKGALSPAFAVSPASRHISEEFLKDVSASGSSLGLGNSGKFVIQGRKVERKKRSTEWSTEEE